MLRPGGLVFWLFGAHGCRSGATGCASRFLVSWRGMLGKVLVLQLPSCSSSPDLRYTAKLRFELILFMELDKEWRRFEMSPKPSLLLSSSPERACWAAAMGPGTPSVPRSTRPMSSSSMISSCVGGLPLRHGEAVLSAAAWRFSVAIVVS